MSEFLIVIGFLAFVAAIIALFRPLPRFGLPTRKHAGYLFAASIAVMVVGDTLSPSKAKDEKDSPQAEDAQEQAPTISSLRFHHVNNLFGISGTLTELQKEHEWEKYKGQCVQWSGTLAHLEEGMWGDFKIGFKHLPHTFTYDVLVTAPREKKDFLMSMRKGQGYTYMAILQEYGNILPVQADWGCD